MLTPPGRIGHRGKYLNAECAEIEGAEDQIDKEHGKDHERRPLRRYEQAAEAFDQADQQTGNADNQRPALGAAEKGDDEGEDDGADTHAG